MEADVKKIIDELIYFKEHYLDLEKNKLFYLIPSQKELGNGEIISLIAFLLGWCKDYFLELAEPDKFEIDDMWFRQYSAFFDKCPELNNVFLLHKEHIGWASSLSLQQQNEIRDYINENYKIQIRIRLDNRLG